MKIAVGLLYYNEYEGLERLLDTTLDFDKVICIDGRFPSFQTIGNSDYSTDGSDEIIEDYWNTQIIKYTGRITEKINLMFHSAAKYDALLYVACDEYLSCDIELLRNAVGKWNEPSHPINVPFDIVHASSLRLRPGIIIKAKPRLFKNPWFWSVGRMHFIYNYKGYTTNCPTITDADFDMDVCTIHHDDTIRKQWRDDLMTNYQKTSMQNRD